MTTIGILRSETYSLTSFLSEILELEDYKTLVSIAGYFDRSELDGIDLLIVPITLKNMKTIKDMIDKVSLEGIPVLLLSSLGPTQCLSYKTSNIELLPVPVQTEIFLACVANLLGKSH